VVVKATRTQTQTCDAVPSGKRRWRDQIHWNQSALLILDFSRFFTPNRSDGLAALI
jgi:hypothetical protein